MYQLTCKNVFFKKESMNIYFIKLIQSAVKIYISFLSAYNVQLSEVICWSFEILARYSNKDLCVVRSANCQRLAKQMQNVLATRWLLCLLIASMRAFLQLGLPVVFSNNVLSAKDENTFAFENAFWVYQHGEHI